MQYLKPMLVTDILNKSNETAFMLMKEDLLDDK